MNVFLLLIIATGATITLWELIHQRTLAGDTLMEIRSITEKQKKTREEELRLGELAARTCLLSLVGLLLIISIAYLAFQPQTRLLALVVLGLGIINSLFHGWKNTGWFYFERILDLGCYGLILKYLLMGAS